MLYAFIGYPPVTRRTMMHLETVARPVLVAHSAFVAVNGEPGLALGRPFGRPHVTFIVAASHWSSMMIGVPYPAHAQPNPADLTLTSRNLPYRTQPRLTPTKHTRGHLATAHQSLPGHIALACALAGGMPYHNQPNRTSPKLNAPDPTEENTTQPKRTLAYLSAGYLSIPRLTWPHRTLTHTHCALAGDVLSAAKPIKANATIANRIAPDPISPEPGATERTLPHRTKPVEHRTASRLSTADRIIPHLLAPLWACVPSMPQPTHPDTSRTNRNASLLTVSQRSHTNQTAPRHSVSDRKRKTPNTCAARDLLKVRGQ
jgi:hypothetical protein